MKSRSFSFARLQVQLSESNLVAAGRPFVEEQEMLLRSDADTVVQVTSEACLFRFLLALASGPMQPWSCGVLLRGFRFWHLALPREGGGCV